MNLVCPTPCTHTLILLLAFQTGHLRLIVPRPNKKRSQRKSLMAPKNGRLNPTWLLAPRASAPKGPQGDGLPKFPHQWFRNGT